MLPLHVQRYRVAMQETRGVKPALGLHEVGEGHGVAEYDEGGSAVKRDLHVCDV